MPLYIKDPEVDALARELADLDRSTKAAAVKAALRHEIAQRRRALPLRERLARAFALAEAAGPFAPGDHKADTDDLWGER
jgi:antitoxin VapB